MTLLQTSTVAVEALRAAGQIAGLATVAGIVAGICAFAYRWYAGQRAPTGLVMLVGLGVVAAYLNTRTALGQVIDGASAVSLQAAFFNIGAVVAAAFVSAAGQRVGDRFARDVFAATGTPSLDGDLSRVVRAVGRVITVELPEDIDDIVGYDPIDEDTKAKLEGRSFIFPRRLTVSELRERLTTRLKTDYGVGHVDLELDDSGQVTYLAAGRRAAGIGPTLPPEAAAMAIRADPAHATGAGDVVQVWSEDGSERLCNAEIRGTAGEVVTVALDAADTTALDPGRRYQLVTLSVDARPDREFASLLRAADETMGVVEIGADSALDGAPIGAIDATVIAVNPVGADQRLETLPGRERVLEDGESVYVIATPEALRKVELAATGPVGRPEAEPSL